MIYYNKILCKTLKQLLLKENKSCNIKHATKYVLVNLIRVANYKNKIVQR